MKFISLFSMIHDIRSDWRRGRFLRGLESANFSSGIGDSAWLLYGMVRTMKPEVCVEIGSARGKSACYVGLALKDNGKGKLYAIDPHARTDWNDADSAETFEAMKVNLASVGVQDHVQIVRERSDVAAQIWSLQIDFLFIDGDHSYEGVKRDWKLFVPFVKPFGLVVFHDTLWDLRPDPRWTREDMGVPRFVDELRKAGYPVLTLERDFGVSIIQPAKNGMPLSKVHEH